VDDEEALPLSSWLRLKSDPQKCSDPDRSLEDTEDNTVLSDDLEALLR
jgi:hypothetical protein